MEHVQGLLSVYIDGALGETERLKVEAHLRQCSACGKELEALRQVSRLVSSLPRAPLPAGFLDKLRAKRSSTAPERMAWLPSQTRLAALAAAGVFVGLIFYQYKTEAPSELQDLSNEPSQEATRSSARLELPAEARKTQPPKAIYTNESLHAYLEDEKKRMGIKEILPKKYAESGRQASDRALSHEETMDAVRRMTSQISLINRQREARLPPPVSIKSGAKPMILANKEESRPFSGAGGALQAAASPSSLVGVRGQASVVEENYSKDFSQKQLAWSGLTQNISEGAVVIKNAADWTALWPRLDSKKAIPSLDFSREMAVGVFLNAQEGTPQIISVSQEGERLVVRYRRTATKQPQPKGQISYHILVVPLVEQPIHFEQAP